MIKVKLPCSEAYESHMEIHTSTVNKDINLEREFDVQDRKDVPHTAVKMPCAITQFPELPFLGQMQNLVE